MEVSAAETAIGIYCQIGEFNYYLPWTLRTLLKLRLVSREIKKKADESLGGMLSSKYCYSSFKGPPITLETDLSAMFEDLRRLCAALGGPPSRFILGLTIGIKCNAAGTAIIAPPLSFLAQLCTIGVRVRLAAREVSSGGGGGCQRETVSLSTVVLLPGVTELSSNASTASVLHWLLRCVGTSPPGLEAFTYMGRALTRKGAAVVMDQLSRQPRLKSFIFTQYTIEGLVLKKLTALASLTRLDLSSNRLNRSPALFAAALAPLTRIQHLDLSSNCLSGELSDIAGAFPPALTELNLSANGLGANISAVSDLLSRLPALTSLNLSFNDLRDEGALSLPLSRLTALTILNLQNNGISPTWAPAGMPWLTRQGDNSIYCASVTRAAHRQ
jgi:hypothetical protein